jgi:chorismate synthase
MSLNAIKGVEIGLGFEAARRPGSKAHDGFAPKDGKVAYLSNRSGGIDGGMSTGQTLIARAAMKPLATLMKPLDSVDLRTMKPAKAHVERSDVTAVPSAAVIAESLVCLVLADEVLRKFGGDSMAELLPRLQAWNP